MKNVKKISLFLLIMGISLSFNFNVLAVSDTLSIGTSSNISSSLDGDLSLNEGAQIYIPNENDLLMDKTKLDEGKSKLSSTNISGFTTASVINKQLSVTVFKQSNSYYCGPATVKEVLHYLLGSSKSQSDYASDLGTTTDGTTMTNIPDVLNEYQNECYYMYSVIDNMDDWSSKVSSDINLDNPVVIDIKSTTSNWPYATSGHYMCISGYDNSGSTAYVWVADPHPTYYGTYKYTANKVYTVNMAHFRHAIVW